MKHWLSALFFLLTLLFIGLLIGNVEFQAWAFTRHQNQLSWYIRPILILPIIYFSYRKSLLGISASIFALFTSMIWFWVPKTTSPLVKEFLAYEQDFLEADWNLKKVLFAFLVISFFLLLIRATWLHSWKLLTLLLIITAFLKMIWSYLDSGRAGLTIVVPAILGLFICLFFLSFWKKGKS